MGKSSKAPEYASTTNNTNLYGSSTTNKNGTTFSPTNFQSNLVNNVEQQLPNTLNEYINPTYNSDLYKAQQEQRNINNSQNYDANVLGDIANRGLMRSSGLQAQTNIFADNIANQEAQAMADYKAQQANNLSQLMGLYEIPYNMMIGNNNTSQNLSNAVSNNNLLKYNAGSNGMLYNMLSESAAGAGTGAQYGGGWGALIGGVAGATNGAMRDNSNYMRYNNG